MNYTWQCLGMKWFITNTKKANTKGKHLAATATAEINLQVPDLQLMKKNMDKELGITIYTTRNQA